MAEATQANKSKPSKDTVTGNNSNNKLSEDTVTGNNSTSNSTTNNKPIIEYFGEGADAVEFTIDPNATRIRVYATGLILTDY